MEITNELLLKQKLDLYKTTTRQLLGIIEVQETELNRLRERLRENV